MTLDNWAENEIGLACETAKNKYYEGCYKKVYEAFMSIMNDKSSCMCNMDFAEDTFRRLINDMPLTPIEDSDFYLPSNMRPVDKYVLERRGLKSSIQCPRMIGLFKEELQDGTIVYRDIYRALSVEEGKPLLRTFLVSNAIDMIFPITMPYMPSLSNYYAYTDTVLSKDMRMKAVHIQFVITPAKRKVDVDRYFKLEGAKCVEINKEEFGGIKNDNGRMG